MLSNGLNISMLAWTSASTLIFFLNYTKFILHHKPFLKQILGRNIIL